MNTKKLLQILEIVCPFFSKANDGNGDINKNNPLGYAIWFPTKFAFIFKAIWSEDNEVLTAAEKMFRFCINLMFSIAIIPICLLFWIVGNLIYAINYDTNRHKKSNLFLAYSAVLTLVIALIVMVADYKADGKIQDMIQTNINESVEEVQPRSVRKASVKTEPIVTDITSDIEEIVSEIVTSEPEIIEGVTEVTTTIESYKAQRVTR